MLTTETTTEINRFDELLSVVTIDEHKGIYNILEKRTDGAIRSTVLRAVPGSNSYIIRKENVISTGGVN